ncbi:MAG TPA: hypothetical protein DCM14_04045 [Clostridiales bacterium UBA8153]|nr:hypothetical protein [Clostridiales bacterium UBA8153]
MLPTGGECIPSRIPFEPFKDFMVMMRLAATVKLAGAGWCVLGLAYRGLTSFPAGEVEKDAVFPGLVGIRHPPRPEAFPAIARLPSPPGPGKPVSGSPAAGG